MSPDDEADEIATNSRSQSDALDEIPLTTPLHPLSRSVQPGSAGDGEDEIECVSPSLSDGDDEHVKVRSRVTMSDPAVRARADEVLTAKLTHEQRNTMIVGIYKAAQKRLARKGRQRFSAAESELVLEEMRDATGETNLTWDSAQQRVLRMRKKETVVRISGSGRKSTFTPSVEDAAARVARSHGGDISRSLMFDLVKAEVGSPKMCSRSTFLLHLNKKFKRRRVKYRPKLTESHQAKRVAFAEDFMSSSPKKEERIVFVDEKRFDVASAGTLTLPEGDNTPPRYLQSRTNPLFVMVLVGVMKPVNQFNGVVGRHAFVERVAAKRNSKNREQGSIELKAFNVTGETYIDAWKNSMFPSLKRLIDNGDIAEPSREDPLFLQDDNAKPHRKSVNGKRVTERICEIGLKDFGIFIQPLEPSQPPQSPDTNPLDTFVFRMMNVRFRRLRAVKSSVSGFRIADSTRCC